MNSLKKSSYFKTIALAGFIFAFSLFGFDVVFGYGGVGGGKPPTSKTVTAVNHPMTLLPEQEGNSTGNFGQQATVILNVPKGSVENSTTFKIQMSAANANRRPDAAGGVYMVGNKTFLITATDIDHDLVKEFSNNLTVTIALPEMINNIDGLNIYYFDGSAWILVPDVTFNSEIGTAVFSVNHLTVFAVLYGNENSVAVAKELQKEVKPETEDEAGDDEFEVVAASKTGFYTNGALIRGNNKKVYVISNGVKQHISTLEELRKYAGQPITNVDDETLAQYGGVEITGAEYRDGTLIRGKNMKIYVIANGVKQHISALKELRKYAGQPITNVDDETLAQYNGVSAIGTGYGNGALIRGKNMKTYVIINGKKKYIVNLEELKNYAGQSINNVDDSVLERY